MTVETVALPVMNCKHCGHRWIARQVDIPKACPNCKRPIDLKPGKKEAR